MRLKEKVALITGAGSGIGQEIAVAMAREGAVIAINDIADEKIHATAKRLDQLGVRYEAVKCDVSSSADVSGMFNTIIDKFGTVDILVNNAGITINDEKINQN